MHDVGRVWHGAPPAWTVRRVEPDEATTEPAPGTGMAFDRDSDDATLVEACVAGHRDAFDILVTRHRRTVYRVCYRFAGNHEDASDLAQEVFVRAYRGLRAFRGHSSVSTWLYRIAVNTSLNRVAASRPPHEALDAARHVDARSPRPDEGLVREQRATRVRAAIARLPDRQRATLILRVYHELTHEQIAKVFGTSVGAVKANFFHALRNLKRRLGSKEDL